MTGSPEDCAATVARRKNPVTRAQKNATAKEAVIQRTRSSRCMRTLLYPWAKFTNTRSTPVNRSWAILQGTGSKRTVPQPIEGECPVIVAASSHQKRPVPSNGCVYTCDCPQVSEPGSLPSTVACDRQSRFY